MQPLVPDVSIKVDGDGVLSFCSVTIKILAIASDFLLDEGVSKDEYVFLDLKLLTLP